jgi:antitoxin YefM
MQTTYQVKEAQSQLPRLLRQAEAGALTTIMRHNKPVAHIISAERLAAIAETMEILADPEAMKALRAVESGKARLRPAKNLPE